MMVDGRPFSGIQKGRNFLDAQEAVGVSTLFHFLDVFSKVVSTRLSE